MRNITFIFLLLATVSFAQNARYKGVIHDGETGESIPFAKVVLKQSGILKYACISDIEGLFQISSVEPGDYIVEISFLGFGTITQGIVFRADEMVIQDYDLLQERNGKCISYCEFTLQPISLDKDREVGAPPK